MQLVPGCKVEGNALKSTVVKFDPKDKLISRDKYQADCQSAGAVGLVLQMITPCLLFQEKEQCKLTLLGGTHVNYSPTMFPVEHVLIPALKKMGINLQLSIHGYGFYPDIKGKVEVIVPAIRSPIQPISLLERGSAQPTKLMIRVKPADPVSQGYY